MVDKFSLLLTITMYHLANLHTQLLSLLIIKNVFNILSKSDF